MIFPWFVAAMKKSPFGALIMVRGAKSSFVAYRSTLNPSGACGQTLSGRGTGRPNRADDFVAYGSGRSFAVM